ncbi:hypothetical protein QBC46DRAFT_345366 [Diplogelasinospora grovesii]|uniref:Uncharacterized protein n=1 Tax=Diplogelasinospora grovesii TaxID=303347 RepID=A0AAN6N0V6_9PEZI|nr:hypothetical protein QBC46DRAFT_345366 [Diplogelasinospora grovesii]
MGGTEFPYLYEVPTEDLPEEPVSRFVRRASGEIWSALGPAYAEHYEWITAGLNARVRIPIKWAILVGKITNSPPDARTKFFSSLESIWLLQCGLLGSNSPAVHEIKGRDEDAWLAHFDMLASPCSLASPLALAERSSEENLITVCRLLLQHVRCSVDTELHNLRRDPRGGSSAEQENGIAADRDGLQGDEAAGGDAETEMWCHVEKADGVS